MCFNFKLHASQVDSVSPVFMLKITYTRHAKTLTLRSIVLQPKRTIPLFSIVIIPYSCSIDPSMWPMNGFCEVQASSVLSSQAALHPSVCAKVLLMRN